MAEQQSQAGGSTQSDNTSQQGWGTMGGNAGDGIVGQQQSTFNPPSQIFPSTPGGGFQRQQQPQQSHYPPGSGSVTRFATPDMNAQQQQQQQTPSSGSYATRSAQAYASYQPSPQQQQTTTPQGSYATSQNYMTSQSSTATGSYAARSQQAYASSSQQQQQQQQQQPPGSYAARSAGAFAGPQQQNNIFGSPQGFQSQQQQQQQQQGFGQSPGYGASVPQSVTSPPVGGGSYAARSAQARAAQPQPSSSAPMGGYGQQQPQPSGGYAARSAQAYAGQQPQPAATNQPQMGQQQQPSGGYAAQANGAQQPPVGSMQQPEQPPMGQPPVGQPTATGAVPAAAVKGPDSPQAQAAQQRMLTDATRKVQEHAYYMRQAMDQKNLPVVLDRAAHMVGELGGPPHGHHYHHHQQQHTSTTGYPTNTGISPKLTPKNYYELYMRALEEMPTFEDYLFNLVQQPDPDRVEIVASAQTLRRAPYTMRELYDCVQYCPRVLSRLYLQIAAGSALIKSGEVGTKWVLNSLIEAVRCEQNPIRGLFLRNFLLTALRDKMLDDPIPHSQASTLQTIQSEEELDGRLNVVDEQEKGNVKDSYEFIMENFMEMNKLWVRIQHLPGEGRNKDVRKRRERERNDLRILVGTNLVRLSQLESITSKIYGEVILPKILEHIVTCGDPLSQAYLMDCLVQVFPDEYHIETLPILLNVCPRMRDKVNIRTILQGLMDRLANYLADEELLDESDSNQVKKTLARDSFGLFEECVQNVYNARGPKLTSKEVIRLQTALLQFSIKCYPGNVTQIGRCLGVCVIALRQANASYDVRENDVGTVPHDKLIVKALDEASVTELEKLLSIPLDSMALKVLELDHYSDLIGFLPWNSRRDVAKTMLAAVDKDGSTPGSVKEIEELFSVIEPVIRDEPAGQASARAQDPTGRAASLMAGLGVSQTPPLPYEASFSESDTGIETKDTEKENALVCKLVHLLDHEDTDVLFEMLNVARNHIIQGGKHRTRQTLLSVVFASIKLARRIHDSEQGTASGETKGEPKTEETALPNEQAATGSEEGGKEERAGASAETAEEGEAAEPMTDTSGAPEEISEGLMTEETENVGLPDEAKENPEKTGATSDRDDNRAMGADETTDKAKQTRTKVISCRKVFVFIQDTIAMLGKADSEIGVKLYLESALTADTLAIKESEYAPVSYELLSQAYTLYEETVTDSKVQQRCVTAMIGTMLAAKSLSAEDYESLVTKTAQFAAKLLKKPDQCQLVALCAHLFYPIAAGDKMKYSNAQRALECLQRSLKLADACTSANPSHVKLFVDLLDHYVFFFEKKNPVISHAYITGLVSLIKEHLGNLGDSTGVSEAKAQFVEVVRYIKRKKSEEASAELFAQVQVDNVGA